jgi:hypothetical protein
VSLFRALPAQEMTKWFDTNCHYLVPEFTWGQAILVFVGSGAQTVEVRETPKQILRLHLGPGV